MNFLLTTTGLCQTTRHTTSRLTVIHGFMLSSVWVLRMKINGQCLIPALICYAHFSQVFSLRLCFCYGFTAPCASAAGNKVRDLTPIVYIRGNGEPIYDSEGNEIPVEVDDLFNDEIVSEEDGITKEKLIESCVNILLPFLTEGMLMDKWDTYSQAIYEEFSPLFEKATLDCNGNPQYGTAVSAEELAKSEYNAANIDFKNPSVLGWCRTGQYDFCYDWCLSPYDHVDRLHEYILTVMDTTNSDGICIAARCMGGGLLNAYLEKYGLLGHVKNVLFSDTLSNEATVISKIFSGQIEFDATLLERYAGQLDFCGQTGDGVGFKFGEVLYEIVFKSMSFFNQIGATDSVLGGVEDLYEKLYKALIPALLHATGMATQINYWTEINENDIDAALDLVFGKEGTEYRVKYAGLI